MAQPDKEERKMQVIKMLIFPPSLMENQQITSEVNGSTTPKIPSMKEIISWTLLKLKTSAL